MLILVWTGLGAILGSVANALVYRLPKKINWYSGRSVCPHCKHTLSWYDLIPLFSYISLLGKCRYCHKPIGLRYFLVELLLAAGFVYLHTPLLAAILFITTIIAFMDWETFLVSDLFIIAWGILVIAHKFLISNSVIDLNTLIGLGAAVGLIGGIWLFSRGRAMGFGDVEIAAIMGLWLGWPKVGYALWIAFVTGAIVGVYYLIRGKKKMKSQLPFGPFLILGSWIAFLVQWHNVLLF